MLRFLTAGESHGPGLVTVVEGLPAGLSVTAEALGPEIREVARAIRPGPDAAQVQNPHAGERERARQKRGRRNSRLPRLAP